MRDSLNYSHANLPDFDLTQLIFSPRNKVLCLGSSTGMSVIFFRCIEAMYGTSPDFVEISGSNYCSYYQSMVRVRILVYDLLEKESTTQWNSTPFLNAIASIGTFCVGCKDKTDKENRCKGTSA